MQQLSRRQQLGRQGRGWTEGSADVSGAITPAAVLSNVFFSFPNGSGLDRFDTTVISLCLI